MFGKKKKERAEEIEQLKALIATAHATTISLEDSAARVKKLISEMEKAAAKSQGRAGRVW